MGVCGDWKVGDQPGTANFANWGQWRRELLCLTLNTFGMLCRRFTHFGGGGGTSGGCWGRVSVGTTVNKNGMLVKIHP